MRKTLLLIVKGISFLLLCSLNVEAQWVKSEKEIIGRDLANSKLIHASEISLKPGEKTILHTHPAHFYYALTDGTIKVHYQDGKDEIFKMKAGESGVSEPERPHTTQNIGPKKLKFLVVELKEHPYKAAK
ncbi:MAG: cupin domain-containing protein [Bacteroidota bacterium]